MNVKLITGWLLVIACTLILLAAGVLVLTNAGDRWTLHVYWKDIVMSRAVWLLLAGAGGAVVYLTVRKMLPRAIRDLRQGAHIRREKITRRNVAEMARNNRKPPQG